MILTRYILRYNAARYSGTHVGFFQQLQATSASLRKYKSTIARTTYENRDSEAFDDSEIGEDDNFPEPHPRFFERNYDGHVKKEKTRKSALWKTITKRKYFPEEPQPRMLTWNEMQQMKFLHEKDPEEWTPERLSESFPVLPEDVSKILRANYSSTLDSIRRKDKKVLHNWHLLNKNELSAKPEFLQHLKKFTNRYEHLKVQLENPSYYKLPEPQKAISAHGGGEWSRMLASYASQVEALKERQLKQMRLNSGTEHLTGEENPSAISACELKDPLKHAIEMEKEIQNITNEDSFVIDKDKKFLEDHMTLDDLKKSVIEKADCKNSSLSFVENMILETALRERNRSKCEEMKCLGPETVNDEKRVDDGSYVTIEQEDVQRLEAPIIEETPRPIGRGRSRSRRMRAREDMEYSFETSDQRRPKEMMNESETEQPEMDEDTIQIGENNLHILYQCQEFEPEKEEKPKKRVNTPVKYYGTEKDAAVFAEYKNLLSGTAFWNSEDGAGQKSGDVEKTSGKVASPHVPRQDSNSYDNYPQKIKVPKNKGKDVIYKIKDCFYDYDGKFLYRVPGLTE